LRLRLPTPGLVGSPHVHSSCLAPVSSAGMSTHLRLQARPGLSPRVLPTVGLYKKLSKPKKMVLPRAHGSRPRSVVYSFGSYCPPRGGGSRSGISPAGSAAAAVWRWRWLWLAVVVVLWWWLWLGLVAEWLGGCGWWLVVGAGVGDAMLAALAGTGRRPGTRGTTRQRRKITPSRGTIFRSPLR
jgi:hypothetical protein